LGYGLRKSSGREQERGANEQQDAVRQGNHAGRATTVSGE
jgi:hypothetical protein